MPSIDIELPIAVVSEANQKEHHMARYRRKTKQQHIVMMCYQSKTVSVLDSYIMKGITESMISGEISSPYEVEMVRVKGYRAQDFDDDNLVGAFKHIRDAIAKYILHLDDGKQHKGYIVWNVSQEKAPKEYLKTKQRSYVKVRISWNDNQKDIDKSK